MPLTRIQSLGITDGTIVNADINASAAIAGTKLTGVGKVLQVVSTQVTSTISTTITTAGTFYDLSGLTASITPSSASNKILVIAQISTSASTSAGNRQYLKVVRGATDIAIGDSGTGYRVSSGNYSTDTNSTNNLPIIWYDSPNTTSSTTYKLQGTSNASSQTFYINRGVLSQGDSPLTASQILLIEIAG
jgi:hypothetical protein